MQNLQQKFNALKPNEKFLLVFACILLIFAFTKFFVIDNQQEKLKNMQGRASLIAQQKNILINTSSTDGNIQKKQTNVLVSDFLRRHNNSEKLKNIRATTNSGEQRYELESIEFNLFLDLLAELNQNGSQHSMLQLKENKIDGTVNAVMISK